MTAVAGALRCRKEEEEEGGGGRGGGGYEDWAEEAASQPLPAVESLRPFGPKMLKVFVVTEKRFCLKMAI